ncbi:MAG: SDR family NAD(P)-dependent oxidoreductase [Patulibacter sp.]|nr:SDR family NAD(P)-dependent oxidoreductase [Patulibacter sp.]
MLAKDTVAIVTGGASGLGEGTVRMLAEAGGRAAILDLPGSAGAEIAEELGDDVAFLPVDVSNTDQVRAAVDGARERFGRIDAAICCAGISPAGRTVNRKGEMFSLDVFRKTIEVNLIGLYDVVRNAARHMADNEPGVDGERGVIVNVASIAAMEGQAGQTAYTASKGGIAALTLPLARDLAPLGIRVLSIAPGIMDTAMVAGLDDERREKLIDLNLFPKRLGRPDDFASLVRTFLETTMFNGEVVRLDAATRLG